MNHLAHLALAAPDEEHMVGSFLGDHVKGVLRGERAAGIEAGIRLHRFIDATTNRDPGMQASARRFGTAGRRAASILIDIVADHFLARSFERWHEEQLVHFTERAYAVLARHRTTLPPTADALRDRLARSDGLAAYDGLQVVRLGFERIAARLQRGADLRSWLACLEGQYLALDADFAGYYPRIRAAAAAWLASDARGDS